MTKSDLIRLGGILYRALRLKYLVFFVLHAAHLYRIPYIRLQSIQAIDGVGLFVRGWAFDPENSLSSIELLLSNRTTKDITRDVVWVSDERFVSWFGSCKVRLKPRFIAVVRIPDFQFEKHEKYAIKFTTSHGRSLTRRRAASQTRLNPIASVETILRQIPRRDPEKRIWFDRVYGPVIEGIWASRKLPEKLSELEIYNEEIAPSQALVSLIIPIYGRYDFIEFQLSAFVNDPDMQNYEIIYVIDDPELSAHVRQSCEELAKIYRIAFKILYLFDNRGYAGANNEGVRFASANQILLLNSDVMPARHGWLRQLLDSVEEGVDSSLTSVRLLYEDNSIQHTGMSFLASPVLNEMWANVHPAKGMPADLAGSITGRLEAEAVTGACVLMSRDNFNAIGGFDEGYILGDYEDSDLCMKAREFGLSIYVNNEIELYHLERQSQGLVTEHNWKEQLTYYNCWRHTSKWDTAIHRLKGQGLGAYA